MRTVLRIDGGIGPVLLLEMDCERGQVAIEAPGVGFGGQRIEMRAAVVVVLARALLGAVTVIPCGN